MVDKEELMCLAEVAMLLNISKETVWRFVEVGELECVRVVLRGGGKVRIKRDSVERMLEKHKERMSWLLDRK